MSISFISSAGSLYPVLDSSQANDSQGAFNTILQLAAALQSGNLARAQRAYDSLMSFMHNWASGQPNTAVSSAFDAVGKALAAGNLPAAQQAFATFRHGALRGGLGTHGNHGSGAHEQVQSRSSASNAPDSLSNNPSGSGTSSGSADNSEPIKPASLINLLT